MLSFRHTKQTSKNVADTTFKEFYPVNKGEHSTRNTQICKKKTYKHWQEQPTLFKPLPKVSETWKKRLTDSCFDVTMGSFDGTKICELVGLYIQSKLEKILPKFKFGLYRDDGLVLLSNLNGQQTDKVRKNIIEVFKDIGFSLEIETNLKEVDFLSISLILRNGTYRPYKKSNDRLIYIHNLSKHPPNVIKQIPNSIQDRLSKNSSNEEIFNTTKCEYEDLLRNNEFKVDFKYTKNQRQKPQNRSRNIIWFNSPLNKFFFD